MDYILEQLATWISKSIGGLLNMVTAMFASILAPNMDIINAMFPDMGTMFTAVQVVGGVLLILILLFQLIRIMMGNLSDNGESILKLVLRSMLFLFLIVYAGSVMDLIIGLAVEPYNYISTINNTGAALDFTQVSDGVVAMGNGIKSESTVNLTTLPFDAGIVVNIIIMAMIGWNYVKLLIEVVERYLLLGVMYYTSPLAMATGGSESTSNIFKNWCRMLGSQLILMILNIWFLRVVNSGIGKVMGVAAVNNMTSTWGAKTLILLGIAAMLRIAQHMDSYLSALGVNTAQTGQGLSMDLLSSAMAIKNVVGGATSAVFGGKGALTNRFANAMAGNGMGQNVSNKALSSASPVSGLSEGFQVGAAKARMENGLLNKNDKSAIMGAFNGTKAQKIDDKLANQFMRNLAPNMAQKNSNALDGAAAALASAKGAKKAKMALKGSVPGQSDGTAAALAGAQGAKKAMGINPQQMATPFGKKAMMALNASAPGQSDKNRYAVSNVSTTGKGGVTGQMDVDGRLTNFAITRDMPKNGYAGQTQLSDGSTGYIQYDNKDAVMAMSDYGKGAFDIGNEPQTFQTYEGEDARQILGRMNGLDSSQYDSVMFANDGQTLLNRADGMGTVQVMPLGAVSGDYDNVETFVGKDDGMVYGIQPYSGTAFSYIDNAMLAEGKNDLYTNDTSLVQSLNENYAFKIPVDKASVHYDEDGVMDYIAVVAEDGGRARLHDPALVEQKNDYGGFTVAPAKEEKAEEGIQDLFVENAAADGSFNGNAVKSKKKLWYERIKGE